MPPLSSRRLWVLLLSLTMMFLLDVAPAVSQENTQFAGTMFLARRDHYRYAIDAKKGHYLGLYLWQGSNHSTGEEAFLDRADVVYWCLADAVQQTGSIQGYSRLTVRDDSVLLKWTGLWTTTQPPAGCAVSRFEGTFSLVEGTGKFANIEGTGTFEGKMTTPKYQVVEVKGEYSIKRGDVPERPH
jgi:hypothetical protein